MDALLRERDLLVTLVQFVEIRLTDRSGVLKSMFEALSLLENTYLYSICFCPGCGVIQLSIVFGSGV